MDDSRDCTIIVILGGGEGGREGGVSPTKVNLCIYQCA